MANGKGADSVDRLAAARHWVTGVGVAAAVVTLLVAGCYNWPTFPITFMWATAAVAVGAVVGFLFGIPKSGRRAVAPGAAPAAPTGIRANTNLEEVSDWLTKILVGVTLIQYNQFLAAFRDAAGTFARALGERRALAGVPPPAPGGDQADLGFASAVLVVFAVGGALFGYLLTLFSSPLLGRAMTATERLTEELQLLHQKVDKVSADVAEGLRLQEELGRQQEGGAGNRRVSPSQSRANPA